MLEFWRRWQRGLDRRECSRKPQPGHFSQLRRRDLRIVRLDRVPTRRRTLVGQHWAPVVREDGGEQTRIDVPAIQIFDEEAPRQVRDPSARKQECAFGDMAVKLAFPGAGRPSLGLESRMQLARVMQEREDSKAGDGRFGKQQPSRPLHAVPHRRQSRKRLEACRHIGAVMDEPMICPALRFAPSESSRARLAHGWLPESTKILRRRGKGDNALRWRFLAPIHRPELTSNLRAPNGRDAARASSARQRPFRSVGVAGAVRAAAKSLSSVS